METNLRNTSSNWRAIIMVAVGAIMISFSSVFVKLADVGPIAAGFYRLLFGAVLLLPPAFFFRFGPFVDRRSLALSIGCATLFALDLTVWHKSIHGVGPGLATVLANFQVFVLAGLGAVVFKERVTTWTLLSLVLAVMGLLLLVGPGWTQVSPTWRMGVIYGLATAVVYSGYILLLRRLQAGQDHGVQIWNIVLVSALAAGILAGEVLLSGETFTIPNRATLVWLVAYGFCGQTLGWYLISRGLPLIDVSVTGIVILLQPALAFIWDLVFFARPTTALEAIGAVLALTAIYLGARPKRA